MPGSHPMPACLELTPARHAALAECEGAAQGPRGPQALALFRAWAAAEAPGGPSGAAVLRLIRAAFAAGHPAAALAACRALRQEAPDAPAPAFLLCLLLLRRADPQATPALHACLAAFPAPAAGWAELGEELLARNHKAAALVCLARGEPGATQALRCGLLARELGRRGEARAFFAAAVAQDPALARAWFLLGTAAQDEGDLAVAAEAYGRVLALEPGRAEAAVNLGIVRQAAGDLSGAKAAYGAALRQAPGTFGRIAQALPGAPRGELWLDLGALRAHLAP